MSGLNFKKLYYYGALSYSFLIPFHQQAATIALILWAFFSVVTFNKKAIDKNYYLLLLPLLYLSYCIGSLFSKSFSSHFLEHKLSFLIFPLIFFIHPYTVVEKRKMYKLFVRGLVVSAIICLCVAFYRSTGFQEDGPYFRPNVLEGKAFMESILYGGNYFFGRYFSVFHQTVYYALYFCVGVTLILFYPDLFKKRTRHILLILFLICIFLISNKASFSALALIFGLRLLTSRLNLKRKVLGFFVILGGMVFLTLTNPRAKESLKKVINGELVLNKNARYGFSTRLLSWDAALTLIKANPVLGYGAGDTQSELDEMYAQKGYVFPLKESYNAHNQWLQIWLENGLFGLLVLTGIFAFLFRIAFSGKENMGFLMTIVVVLLVNSMFESIFNRFSGISFVSFLICLFFAGSTAKQLGVET